MLNKSMARTVSDDADTRLPKACFITSPCLSTAGVSQKVKAPPQERSKKRTVQQKSSGRHPVTNQITAPYCLLGQEGQKMNPSIKENQIWLIYFHLSSESKAWLRKELKPFQGKSAPSATDTRHGLH